MTADTVIISVVVFPTCVLLVLVIMSKHIDHIALIVVVEVGVFAVAYFVVLVSFVGDESELVG